MTPKAFIIAGFIFAVLTLLSMREEGGSAMPIGFLFPAFLGVICFVIALVIWLWGVI